MFRALSVWALLLGPLAVACSVGSGEPGVGRHEEPIIGGAVDTTHDAVVSIALVSNYSLGRCTGTIVKVDPSTRIGWVLTAAHCVDSRPTFVIVGDDREAIDAKRYQVIDYAPHTGYDFQDSSSPNDFAMLRIIGVDASTPVIPILAAADDDLKIGSEVTSVGYGRTTPKDAANVPHTERKSIKRSVSEVSTERIKYELDGGGICSGDSGGPVLYEKDGSEWVVGVHSTVTKGCLGTAASGRMSSVADWLAGHFAMQPPASDCSLCDLEARSGDAPCTKKLEACLGDPSCQPFAECVTRCTSESCRTSCEKKYPLGVGPYRAYEACPCRSSCKDGCSNDVLCKVLPQCGAPVGDDACGACMQSNCCGELLAMSEVSEGYVCLDEQGARADCPTLTTGRAVATCRASACADVCTPKPTATEPRAPAAAAEPEGGGDDGGCAVRPGRHEADSPLGSTRALAFALVAVLFALRRSRRRGGESNC